MSRRKRKNLVGVFLSSTLVFVDWATVVFGPLGGRVWAGAFVLERGSLNLNFEEKPIEWSANMCPANGARNYEN